MIITSVVAETKGIDPLERQMLPPMYNAIDMHMLEKAVFNPELTQRDRTESTNVNFRYAGYRIRLGTDGWVTVYEKR